MIRIGVVILHYNQEEVTVRYVDDLCRISAQDADIRIYVVDNASPDKSGARLATRYRGNPKVRVICSEDNLGFSKGNNLGIKAAEREFAPELFVISNNDIFIEDFMFWDKLISCYRKSEFAVMGPDIYSVQKGFSQSPIRDRSLKNEELGVELKTLKSRLRFMKAVSALHMYKPLRAIRRIFRRESMARKGIQPTVMRENVVIHGAFFVLSRKYLDVYPDGLYPNLFLYMEEDALAIRCRVANLNILYDPELRVLHYDGVSTSSVETDPARKYLFELKHTISSVQALMQMPELHD